MRNVNGHSIYEFGEFVLNVDKLMLYRDEAEISLPPKVVKTLSVLVENRGEILSKDELMERVWAGSVVEESNLSQYLYLLRKTVGNKPDGNPYIETLRRRGYRFNADVRIRLDGSVATRPLPAARPSLIGREREIVEVTDLLSNEHGRIVTISGIGGVGKTTLARAIADRWQGHHQLVFIELASIRRPELMIPAIANAVGVKESPGIPLMESLKAGLRTRPYFLLLDNLEQIASAGPSLSDLMECGTPDLKILVTSRVPLHLPSEDVFTVQPLTVPGSTSLSVDELSDCESIRLFTERSKILQPQFELNPGNLADVASICQKLDGLPLAIELAAARMNFFSPAAVLRRLEKLDFLSNGSSDAPKRQQTIRETIAWSYGLLDDDEKTVFTRLGIFSGGCDLEAAESVCKDLEERSGLTVLDAVSSLVDHNLLVARTAPNGDPRIHMLEVVREFALEILAETSQLERARREHGDYFLALSEDAEPQLVAARSSTCLEKLEIEHDNLRGALAWSRENDPMIGQRISGAIWRFWWLHGHVREACDQLDSFLDIPSADPSVRAKLLAGATFLNRLAGRHECSRRYAEEGVTLSQTSGDLRTGALAFNQLGFLALDTGDLSESERMFDEGLQQARALGDIQILALLNNGLGELSRMKDDYDRAAEFYGKALEYNREAGDRVRQTTCLINLGATAVMREDREAAGAFYRQGLEISSEMADMNGTLYCLEGLAGSYWAARDAHRSALLFGAAHAGRTDNNLLLEPADKIPYEASVALVREALGESLFREGYSDGTKMSLRAATALALEKADVPDRKPSNAIAFMRDGTTGGKEPKTERVGVMMEEAGQWDSRRMAVEVSSHATPHWTPLMIVLLGLGLAAVIGGSVYYFWPRGPLVLASIDRPEKRVTRLTDGNFVWGATISPDGSHFAYTEVDGEGWRLFVQQTGQNVRNEIASSSDRYRPASTFSPDGQWIYYVAGKKGTVEAALFRIPTIGGQPIKLLENVDSTVSFSPDGKQIVFARGNAVDDTSLIITDKDARAERILLERRGPVTIGSNGAWSPDGKSIVFSELDRTNAPIGSRLRIVDVSTGIVSSFSDERWDVLQRIEWVPDGSGVVVIGTRAVDRARPTYHYNVFYVSQQDGTSRRLTNDGNRYDIVSLAMTKDGSLLVVPSTRDCRIWSMKASGEAASAEQITRGSADGRAGLVPLPDGRIAYTARTADDLSLWVTNEDGSDAKQIPTVFDYNEELRADPAGRYLVFSTATDPNHHLFRIDPDGSNLKQLTFGTSNEIDSTVSPNGKTIVTHSEDISSNPGKVILKKIPAEGGEPEVLPVENCQSPVFSPSGTMLSCVRNGNEAVIVNASDGSQIQTLPFPENSVANFGAVWMPDETGVIVITHEKGATSNLTVIPRDRRKPFKLTNFTSGTIYRFTFSHDGNRLLVARGYPNQYAVLIQNPF